MIFNVQTLFNGQALSKICSLKGINMKTTRQTCWIKQEKGHPDKQLNRRGKRGKRRIVLLYQMMHLMMNITKKLQRGMARLSSSGEMNGAQ